MISINGTLEKLAFYNGEKIILGKSVCYCNLKPNINKYFVYALMNTNSYKNFLEENSTRSTIKNVGLKAMREYKLIIPPYHLQCDFSLFYEKISKYRLTIQQGLDKMEVMRKALMQEYFE